MPTDVRDSVGVCGNSNPWKPPLQSWQTGGAGAGQIPASVSASIPWPPATISSGGAPSVLPQYTPTGTVPTLPAPSLTVTATGHSVTANPGNGWQNPSDTAGLMVNMSGCSYLDPWIGPTAAPPSPLCSGAAKRTNGGEIPLPKITPPPS
jgi:glucan 1,3-beta-glucosidase